MLQSQEGDVEDGQDVSVRPQDAEELEELEERTRAERSMVIARALGVGFAVLQVSTYDAMPYPPGVRDLGYLLAVVLTLGNAAVWLVLRRVTTTRGARRLGIASLTLDLAVATGFVWLYAFDGGSALYLVYFVMPAVAALRFQLWGALTVWAACAALYVAREVWVAATYGRPLDIVSVNFRMGVLLLLAVVVGLLARDLHRRSRALSRALAELRTVERWRARVVDMLAHDIRSPLGSVVSTLELLDSSRLRIPDERRVDLQRSAIRQTNRVLRLADGLLDLGRAGDGRLALDRRPVVVGELIAEVIGELDVRADVVVECQAGLVAHVDAERCYQILSNLVSNARRHGRAPIVIRARAGADGGLTIEVRDDGPGVPVEQRATLFEPFTAGPRADSVGLGLWIVRVLSEAHGGGISYDGADGHPCFRVHLPPTAPGAERPSSPAEDRPDVRQRSTTVAT